MGGEPVVAVVDDDESVRMALASLLRSVGFAVLLFSSAEELLHRHSLPSIGCLILDWRMPGMDGLQLQRYLSANGWHIPIIFLTAQRSEDGRAQALTGGAIAFLNKPVDAETLLHAVRAGLGQRAEGAG
jgi:FixJ family two-component response regulator